MTIYFSECVVRLSNKFRSLFWLAQFDQARYEYIICHDEKIDSKYYLIESTKLLLVQWFGYQPYEYDYYIDNKIFGWSKQKF